jgi:hypothetical protein
LKTPGYSGGSAADGYEGTDRVPFEVLAERGCKVGDSIAAVMNGRFLVVNARRCGRALTR